MKQASTMNVRALLTQSWAHGYSLATNQKGVAMIMALLAIAAIAMMGAFGAISAQSELQIAGNEQQSKRALGLADAGVRHALRILGDPANPNAYKNGFNDELNLATGGGALGAAGAGVQTLEDGNQYVFFSFGGSSTEGYFVRAVDNFDEALINNSLQDLDQSFLLIARGRVGGAEKVIQAVATPPVECALTFGLAPSTVGGSSSANDVQVNSNEGAGACVHGNGPVTVSGNTTFPDGATASGSIDCQGSGSLISGGTCAANAKGNEPLRNIIAADVGVMSQLVADLGNANVGGPYYILHTKDSFPENPASPLNNPAGRVTRGGRCAQRDNLNSVSASRVGLCNGGEEVDPADVPGVTFVAGGCKFASTTPRGIYYCDGNVSNQGQIPGGGAQRDITFISRDNMLFGSQINLRSFFNDSNSTDTDIIALADEDNNIDEVLIPDPYAGDSTVLPSGELSTIGTIAAGKVKNIFLVSGADLKFTGNGQFMEGIVLVHNEVDFQGGKTITGYVDAGNGLPTYEGDPHPAANIADGYADHNSVLGGLTVSFKNFSTLFPLGPPQLAGWNDDQR